VIERENERERERESRGRSSENKSKRKECSFYFLVGFPGGIYQRLQKKIKG
jgi:hypothetical protein